MADLIIGIDYNFSNMLIDKPTNTPPAQKVVRSSCTLFMAAFVFLEICSYELVNAWNNPAEKTVIDY